MVEDCSSGIVSWRRIGGTAVVALALAGCVHAAPATGPDLGARVIVEFRGAHDPADASFRAEVAKRANVAGLELVRPMSGNAFVMRVGCSDPRATVAVDEVTACRTAVERLRALDAVRSIEFDRKEQHQ